MDAKILGAIQLIGGLIAGYFAYGEKNWAVLILALVFIVMAIHHFMEKK